MERVTDVISIAWGIAVLIVGVFVLIGIVAVGILLLLPILVFLSAFL